MEDFLKTFVCLLRPRGDAARGAAVPRAEQEGCPARLTQCCWSRASPGPAGSDFVFRVSGAVGSVSPDPDTQSLLVRVRAQQGCGSALLNFVEIDTARLLETALLLPLLKPAGSAALRAPLQERPSFAEGVREMRAGAPRCHPGTAGA